MNLSLFTKNLRGPWMIHPQEAAAMMPLVRGVIAGTHIEDIDEAEKKAGQKVSCADYYAGDVHQVNPFTDKSVYVAYLDGTMTKYGTCFSYGTREIAEELLKADQDPDIVGHILYVDSGGGAADSVPELADAIRQLTKPIVGFVDGMAASAAMYAVSYTSKIIAHQPTDQIGCIGTMITISGWPKLRKDSDGYVAMRIYADQSEEKNAEYEAALQGETKLIRENVLNPLCEIFIRDMKENRPSATDDQLKGRTYFAKDVVGTLIDSIGTFEDAVKAVLEYAELADNNSSSQMGKYTKLESIPELNEQVYAEDGSTILQACQLEAIEQALSTPRAEEQELQAQMDSLKQSHQEEVAGLQQTITEKDETISQKDARIQELEGALEEAVAKASGEKPASVFQPADQGEAEADYKPAKTFAEAEEACKAFLNRK